MIGERLSSMPEKGIVKLDASYFFFLTATGGAGSGSISTSRRKAAAAAMESARPLVLLTSPTSIAWITMSAPPPLSLPWPPSEGRRSRGWAFGQHGQFF